MFYTLIKHAWDFDQSGQAQGPIQYIINTHMIKKDRSLQAFHTLSSLNQHIIKVVCEGEDWGE